MRPSRSAHGTSRPFLSTMLHAYQELCRVAGAVRHATEAPAGRRALFKEGEFGTRSPGHGTAVACAVGVEEAGSLALQFGGEDPEAKRPRGGENRRFRKEGIEAAGAHIQGGRPYHPATLDSRPRLGGWFPSPDRRWRHSAASTPDRGPASRPTLAPVCSACPGSHRRRAAWSPRRETRSPRTRHRRRVWSPPYAPDRAACHSSRELGWNR